MNVDEKQLPQLLIEGERGNPDAQCHLGFYYRKTASAKCDLELKEYLEKAVYWYQLAAEQGHVIAQHNLAAMYLLGEGVEKDATTALGWYQKAAEQEDRDSQFNLAMLYERGNGVPQDERKAVYWYKLAAEAGLARAQYDLANCFIHGRGVERDSVQARYWLERASANGLAGAQKLLDQLAVI